MLPRSFVNYLNIQTLFYPIILSLIACLTIDKAIDLHANNFQELVDASFGVLIGKPHWIAYQNRLLGPGLVGLLNWFGLIPQTALKVFFFSTMVIAVNLNFYLLKQLAVDNMTNLLICMALCFSFLALQHKWLYPWDMLSLIIFSLFVFFAIKDYPAWFFLVLYGVALLNRESAYFIMLFLLLRNLVVYRHKVIMQLSTYYYTALLLVGYGYTGWIRHYLFVSKMDGQADEHIEFQGNHVYLDKNIDDMLWNDWLTNIGYYKLSLLAAFLFILVTILTSKLKNKIALALIFIVMFASILYFGLVFETRIYIELIPFLTYALALQVKKEPLRLDS